MTVREIRVFGDPVLRTVCAPIEQIDDGVRALVADLVDTVELPGRAGVAAPQIGVDLRGVRDKIDGALGYVLNPGLAEVRGSRARVVEAGRPVPGLWHDALRHPWARVEGIDLDGEPVVLEGEGLLAQALQHETDHLDGKLYLSRLDAETRKRAMREVRESSWF